MKTQHKTTVPRKLCRAMVIVFTVIFFAICRQGLAAAAEEPAVHVKKAAFAGSFYPADKLSLQVLVDGYLKDTEKDVQGLPPGVFAIIAPHAGYIYSGKVASYAYNTIKGKGYRTVILLGSSHRAAFKGIALYPSGSWETPLGRVTIDTATGRKLSSMHKGIQVNPGVFDKEHSLEVQLPFLQRTLKDFKIVPLLTGSVDKQDLEALANAIGTILQQNRGKVLLVVSSDMSHYHPYSDAVRMDSSTLRSIEGLDCENLSEGIAKESNELCGAAGVLSAMMAARKLGGEAQILHYANSGDVTGDRSKVVGYSSVAFFKPEKRKNNPLNNQEKKKLLSIARKTLEEYVSAKTIPSMDVSEQRLKERMGAFVTLNIHGQLRGCIGMIKAVAPLYKAVIEMTVAASSNDMRFRPVSKGELKDITIEISVLTPLKPINNVDEIKVGTHGLYMVRGGNSGLLLPQVATHYNWSREEFLRQTCSKAGLPLDAWKDRETKIYIFSAQIFSE